MSTTWASRNASGSARGKHEPANLRAHFLLFVAVLLFGWHREWEPQSNAPGSWEDAVRREFDLPECGLGEETAAACAAWEADMRQPTPKGGVDSNEAADCSHAAASAAPCAAAAWEGGVAPAGGEVSSPLP